MLKPASRVLLLAALLVLCACSQQPRTAPSCDDTENFACFRGAFRTLTGGDVSGLEICPLDLDDVECTETNEFGGWTLPGLPKDSNAAVTAVHPDYTATLFPQHTSMDWYEWFKVAVPPFVVNSHASRLDLELDPERGHLLFLTWEGLNEGGIDTPNVSGVTAELLEPVDTAAIFYADSVGIASATATETTSSGSGGWLNLPVGTARVRFSAPAGPCEEQDFHWGFEEDAVIPAPIRAGFVTAIDVMCPVAR